MIFGSSFMGPGELSKRKNTMNSKTIKYLLLVLLPAINSLNDVVGFYDPFHEQDTVTLNHVCISLT